MLDSGFGASGFPWLFDVGLRASVPLLVALLVARLLARRAARLRHATWTMGVLAALLLPAVSWLEPRWHLPLVAELEHVEPSGVAAPPQVPSTDVVSGAIPSGSLDVEIPLRSHDSEPGAEPASSVASGSIAPIPRRIDWRALAVGVWGAGLLGFVWLLARGYLAALRLVRSARPSTDADARALNERLVARLGIERPVALLESDEARTPMTFGWRRPVVLLPSASRVWSRERKEVVLAHELVHVQRHDWLGQIVAQTARAFYWFHPLAWLACRRLSVERERSCDEGVLALGTTPSVYAHHLLSIAVSMQGGRESGAVLAMAHRTQLEGRLMSILEDDGRKLRGGLWLAPVCLLMAGTSGAVAAARTWPAPQERSQELEEPRVTPKRVPVEVPQATPEEPAAVSGRPSGPAIRLGQGGDASHVYARFTRQRSGKLPMTMSGRIDGLFGPDPAPQELLWMEDERLKTIWAEARPLLDALRPHEEALEAVHAEMEPLLGRIEGVQEEMEPFHEEQEALHRALEPFHDRQESLHRDMEPFHEKLQGLHEKLEVLRFGEGSPHEALEPFHRRQEEVHRKMGGLHEERQRLHEELEPLRDEIELRRIEIRKLERERSEFTKENARHGELTRQIEDKEEEIRSFEQRMEPIRKELEGLHERMEPFHRTLERIHEEMAPALRMLETLEERLAPVHTEIEKLHEHMRPLHEHLEHLHEELRPIHEKLGAFHERMRPFHERLEGIHELMEPFHQRMEPILDAMKPILEELEPFWDRMNAVLEEGTRGLWSSTLERAEGAADGGLRRELLNAGPETFELISWGWAVERDPARVRLGAGRTNPEGALARDLARFLEDRGRVLVPGDREALEALARSFTETLSRVRYRL